MAITYKVEHYQINCSIERKGEAAILLLVSVDDAQVAPAGIAIQKAILIDSGFNYNAVWNIHATICDIEAVYGPDFKFDAVVITHWDNDHWYGFSKNDNSLLYFKDLPWTDGKWECFKYGDNDPSRSTTNPLTTFYCPMRNRIIKSTSHLSYDTADFGVKPNVITKAVVNVSFDSGPEAKSAMLYGGDYTRMLSANLFKNGQQAADYTTIKTVDDMVDKNDPWMSATEKTPGLYIVGVDKQFLGKDALKAVVDAGKSEETNASSIQLLLIWKISDTERHITLYAGGDAEFLEENNLILPFLNGAQITTIKAGHHGSRRGTSMKFIDAVKPIHYLVGNGTIMGHPDPCVLWYLDAYWTKNAGTVATTKRIHTTCFPYYLGLVVPDPKNPDPAKTRFVDTAMVYPRAFANTTKWTTNKDLKNQWVDTYRQAMYDKFYKPGLDPAAGLLIELDDLSSYLAQQQWILAQLWVKFLKWSDCEYNYYPLYDKLVRQLHSEAQSTWNLDEVRFVRLTMTGSKPLEPEWLYRTQNSIFPTGSPTFANSSTTTINTIVQAMDLSAAVWHPEVSVQEPATQRRRRAGTQDGYGLVYLPSPDAFRMSPELSDIIVQEEILEEQPGSVDNAAWVFDPPSSSSQIQANSPNQPLASVATRAALTQAAASSKVYIFPSWAVLPSGIFEGQVLRISDETDEGQNMTDFLAALHSGYLSLDTVNQLQKQDPNSFRVKLRFGPGVDGMQAWFGSFFNSQLATNAKKSNPPGLIATMNIDGNYADANAGLQSFRLEVTQFFSTTWKVVFTFQTAFTELDAPEDSAKELWTLIDNTFDSHGIYKNRIGLFMCVQEISNVTDKVGVTLTDLFTLAGLEDLIPSWLPALLSALGINPNFEMDLAPLVRNKLSTPMNGLWFFPDQNHETILRLFWTEIESAGGSNLASLVNELLPGVILGACKVAVKKKAQYNKFGVVDTKGKVTDTPVMTKTGTLCISTSLQFFKNSKNLWDIYILLSATSTDIILRYDPAAPIKGDMSADGDGLTEILDWMFVQIQKVTGTTGDQDTITSMINDLNTIGSSTVVPRIREVAISLEAVPKPKGGHDHHIRSFVLRLQSDVPWGVETKNARVPLQLNFRWSNGGTFPGSSILRFEARLWSDAAPGITAIASLLDPYASQYPALAPMPNGTYALQTYFAIDKLPGFPSSLTLPEGVPRYITSISLAISNVNVQFSGSMSSTPNSSGSFSPPVSPRSHVPGLSLEGVKLSAGYTYASSALAVSFSGTLLLQPPDPTLYTTVAFSFDLKYSSPTWSLGGDLSNVNLAALASFFPVNDNAAVMSILRDITLVDLNIGYSYDSAGKGGTLTINGDLDLEWFTLIFSFTNSPGSWNLHASLASGLDLGDQDIKLGSLLGDLTSDGLEATLPDFVHDITFKIPKNSKLDLVCQKLESGETLYSLDAILGDLEFTFVQIVTAVTPVKKTILKLTIDGLPPITAVPFLEAFEQPFDQVDFIWTDTDLTQDEITTINTVVFQDSVHSEIFYSAPKTTAPVTGTTVVVAKGCHFTVVVEENGTPTPLLDYAFGGQSVTTPPAKQSLQATSNPPPPSTNANGTANVSWSKTLGPLTISALSMTFKDKRLHFIFTIGITIGPASGKIKGLDISVPALAKPKFVFDDIEVSFDGLGVEMNSPPVIIAGILEKLSEGVYAGGIAIEVEPYTFLAGGEYGTITKDGSSFKTLFVFAELAGPLVELEIASISGITGGFGYNSALTLPTAQDVTSFPFIQGTNGTGTDPLTVLNSFISAPVPWFVPEKGPFWIAAGMDVEACEILNVHAVIVLSINSDVILGIFADCTASIPADVPPAETFACVDLGLVAVVDFGKGIFYAEGQLTPKSFILDPACHLTGGFALCYWFKNSGHDGDWVFTVGGYHPGFQAPSWYPNPPRLEISWQFDSHISITGEAYFAITPKVCMGGGSLALLFTAGKLSAHLNAWADFLINYKPFYFQAEIGVDIGISYAFHLGCIHHKFDVDFNATLDLHGPPVAGHVHVDWKIITFDIYFGSSTPNNKPLSWDDFITYIQTSPTDSKTGGSEAPQPLYSINATKGLVTDQSAKYDANNEMRTASTSGWRVDPTKFILQASSLIPFDTATINGKSLTFDQSGQYPTYIKLMHLTNPLTSSITVSITQKGSNTNFTDPVLSQVVSIAPTAIWGQYSSNNEPGNGNAKASLLSTDNLTQPQMTGIQIDFTKPTESQDYIQFNIADTILDPINATSPTEIPILLQSSWSRSDDRWKPAYTPPPDGQTFQQLWEGCNRNQPAMLSAWQYFAGIGDDSQPGSVRMNEAFGDCSNVPLSVTGNLGVNYVALPTYAAEAVNW